MAYNKTFWKDEPSTETPISAENLNKIEQGIYNAHESIDKIPDWVFSGDEPSFDGYTKAETDALLDKKANAINTSASGETVVTTDSANATPSIKLFGKSTQDGTPSLANRVEITPIGFRGSIEITISGSENENVQTLTIQTPNGLHGIPLGQKIPSVIANSPIHMSGVYHDGQQYWIGNTKNENGQDIQRVTKIIPKKTLVFGSRNDAGRCSVYIPNYFENTKFLDGSVFAYSSIAPFSEWAGGSNGTFCINGDNIYYKDSTKTLEEVNAEFAELGTDVEFVGVLKNPIVTDLTEEELAQYNAIHMNYPNTTIVNSDSVYMEVEYVADTKNYIEEKDKKLEERIDNLVIGGGGTGQDGFSPIAKVTDTAEGVLIEITDKNGKTSAIVKDGKDGYTPIKGVDYFTQSDKAEITQSVISALPKYNGEVSSV